MRNRIARTLAIGAASLALTGGIALTSAEAAVAAAPAHAAVSHVTHHRCRWVAGHWVRVWHPGWRDRRGHWHPGHWTRVWQRGHRVCFR